MREILLGFFPDTLTAPVNLNTFSLAFNARLRISNNPVPLGSIGPRVQNVSLVEVVELSVAALAFSPFMSVVLSF